jgi:hypothetical protein
MLVNVFCHYLKVFCGKYTNYLPHICGDYFAFSPQRDQVVIPYNFGSVFLPLDITVGNLTIGSLRSACQLTGKGSGNIFVEEAVKMIKENPGAEN